MDSHSKSHSISGRITALLLVLSMLFSVCGALAEQTATVVAASAVVYSSPYPSTRKELGTLSKGDTITVRAVSASIAKVTYKGVTGYVDATKLSCGGTVQATTKNESATVTVDSLTIYKSASTSAAVLGTARKGAQVTVLATSGSWAAVSLGGKIGYCAISGLSVYKGTSSGEASSSSASYTASSTNSTASRPATVIVNSLTIYKKANTKSGSYGSAMKGASVTVLATSGSWAAVSIGGKIGYCAVSGLSISSGTQTDTGNGVAVTALASLTLYKAASKSSDTYGSIAKGTSVTLLEELGSWAKIRYNGSIYYCALSGLSPSTDVPVSPAPTGTASSETGYTVNGACSAVCDRDLHMYKTPSTSGGYYGIFKQGAVITVTAVSGSWAKITYSSKTGYVLRAGISPTQVTEVKASGYTHKTAGKTNVYLKPSTSNSVVKVLNAGTKVKVTAISGEWLRFNYNGVTCYALEKDFISLSTTKPAIVVYATQSVYSAAKTTASIYGTLSEGDKVEVYSANDGWATILYNNKKGYLPTASIVSSTATYTSLKAGSSGSQVLSMQTRLEALGYFDGVPAGNYGSITTTAVQRFQNERGMQVTGIASPATQAAIYSSIVAPSSMLSKTLAPGSNNTYVKRLQTRLLYKNYYSSGVDGDYGEETASSVTAFQAKAGIAKTGIADPITLAALYSNNAPTGTISRPAGSNGTKSLDPPNVRSDNEDIELVITYALAQLGKPYIYGTAGPNSFDCSGLTYYCFKKIGITLPRSAYNVGYATTLGGRISYSDLKRGDIVCFNTISDSDLSDHVGIYLGEGKFIHAPHTGTDVSIADMTTGYYLKNFSWARRAID